MTVYFLLAILLFVLCFIKRNKQALVISFLVLLVISGFRDFSVGTDTSRYASIFSSYSQESDTGGHVSEPLYLGLMFLVTLMGWSSNTLIFITSALHLAVLYFYVIKESDRPNYSILCYYLLYFFFYSLNVTRQYDAMSLVLLAWYFQEKGNNRLYWLFVFIAFGFHYTAIVALISLFCKKIWMTTPSVIIILFFTYLLGITPIVQGVLSMFGSILPSSFYRYIIGESERLWDISITRFLLTGYCALLVNYIHIDSIKIRLLVIGICMLNLFAFNPVIARAAQYFTALQIVLIPSILSLVSNKRLSLFLSGISLVYMVIVWLFLLASNNGEVVPYAFGTFNIFGL